MPAPGWNTNAHVTGGATTFCCSSKPDTDASVWPVVDGDATGSCDRPLRPMSVDDTMSESDEAVPVVARPRSTNAATRRPTLELDDNSVDVVPPRAR